MIATATIERVSQSIHFWKNWLTIPEHNKDTAFSDSWKSLRHVRKKQSHAEERPEANRTLQSPAAAVQLHFFGTREKWTTELGDQRGDTRLRKRWWKQMWRFQQNGSWCSFVWGSQYQGSNRQSHIWTRKKASQGQGEHHHYSRHNGTVVTEKRQGLCLLCFLKPRELVHQKMLGTTIEEVAADKVHHFGLSLGSWDEFQQFKLPGTSAAEMRF